MFDRVRLALKVLFVPNIIVVTRGEQLSTFDNSTIVSDRRGILIEVRHEYKHTK